MTEPIWLPIEVVIETNRKIVTETGEPFFLRDRALLESAMERPKDHYYYASEDDILNLSTILMFGIARNHPFEQGNKRSGFLSAVLFLERNGYAFSFYDSGSVGKAITFVLEGRMTERKFIESMRPYIVPLD